jgi:hypothetical protein
MLLTRHHTTPVSASFFFTSKLSRHTQKGKDSYKAVFVLFKLIMSLQIHLSRHVAYKASHHTIAGRHVPKPSRHTLKVRDSFETASVLFYLILK